MSEETIFYQRNRETISIEQKNIIKITKKY